MFDITKYEFADARTNLQKVGNSFLTLESIDVLKKGVSIGKDDAIAIAKHFGLISDGKTVHICENGQVIVISDTKIEYHPPVNYFPFQRIPQSETTYTQKCVSKSIGLGVASFGGNNG